MNQVVQKQVNLEKDLEYHQDTRLVRDEEDVQTMVEGEASRVKKAMGKMIFLPCIVLRCCTAILRTVNLSNFRFMAVHIGINVDNSMIKAFILSLRRFSISEWFCLRSNRIMTTTNLVGKVFFSLNYICSVY